MATDELVSIHSFNKSRVRFGPPTTMTSKGNVQYTTCKVGYMNSKNQEARLLLEAPDSTCFGVQKVFAYGKPETPENFQKYQVSYMAENKNAEGTKYPKAPEHLAVHQVFVNTCETLRQLLSTHFKSHRDFFDEGQQTLVDSGKFAKPILRYPKKEVVVNGMKRKSPDTDKPLRAYVKLIQNPKSQKFISRMYGPQGEELDPLTLLSELGTIHPIFSIDSVYIDGKGATFQVKLWEANYTPRGAVNRPRLLSPIAPPQDDSNPNGMLDDDPDQGQDQEFEAPQAPQDPEPEPAPQVVKQVRRVAPVKRVARPQA